MSIAASSYLHKVRAAHLLRTVLRCDKRTASRLGRRYRFEIGDETLEILRWARDLERRCGSRVYHPGNQRSVELTATRRIVELFGIAQKE